MVMQVMVMQVSIGSAVVTAMGIGVGYYQQRRQHSRRREQLLIQGLHQAEVERPVQSHRLALGRQLEMETLLANLRTETDRLVEALAAEERLGSTISGQSTADPSLFQQWEASRRAAEQAHETYSETVQEYREFVHSLAPPLRASAAKLGCTAMAIARA